MPYLRCLLLLSALTLGMRVEHDCDHKAPYDGFFSRRRIGTGVTPATEITLTQQKDGDTYATVNLTMTRPAIVLENIEDVSGVTCRGSSVDISFSSSGSLDVKVRSWMQQSSLILVTRHLGDCDANDEPGFYITNSIALDSTKHMLTAQVEKKDLAEVVSSVRASFSSLSFNQQANSSFTGGPPWETTYTSPAGLDVSEPPSVIGRSGQGYFNTMLSYTGYADYDIGKRPRQFFIDMAIVADNDIPLELNLTGAYNDTVELVTATLTGYTTIIPGILEIQPDIVYTAGANIIGTSATVASTNLSSGIVDGHIHIDLADPGSTTVSGLWDGNYGSGVSINPIAGIRVGPFVGLTTSVAANLTGAPQGFFQGFKGVATSVYDFQPVGAALGSGISSACTYNAYGYTMVGFDLGGWRRTLIQRQDPFTGGC